MRGTDFADIERGLYTALDQLADVISSSQRDEVNAFIAVGEYGVALETLCAILMEEGIDVRNKDLRQLTDLADAMGIRNTTTDQLAKAGRLAGEGDNS